MNRLNVFLDINIDNIYAGRLVFELYNDILPKTSLNFYHLCVGDKGLGRDTNSKLHYKNCIFHRVVKGFVAQSGDFSHHNGIGGESIYGGQFQDEAFPKRHYKAGMLSMANSGPDTNGSQFFITLARTPMLDRKHVCFGHLKQGAELLQKIESVPTDRNDCPMGEIKIIRCGDYRKFLEIEKKTREEESLSLQNQLEEKQKDVEEIVNKGFNLKPKEENKLVNKADNVGPDISKMSAREKKFYELQLKFRSSARKTKREVMREYKRIGKGDKKSHQNESQQNDINTNKKTRVKIHSLTASDAGKLYEKRDKKEKRKNGVEDRAFNAYMRKVEGLQQGMEISDESCLASADNLEIIKNVQNDREKVDKLAEEIKQNQENRRKFSRRRKYNEEKDIDYINRRNEAFNSKVARAFDKYTFEIKANLERGTAL